MSQMKRGMGCRAGSSNGHASQPWAEGTRFLDLSTPPALLQALPKADSKDSPRSRQDSSSLFNSLLCGPRPSQLAGLELLL